MRKLISIYTLLLPAFFTWGQVFIGTDPTQNPVLLEVVSNNKGVLIPRIEIPDTLTAAPVTNPKEGLIVMNTYPGKEGLYSWNGTAWEMLKTTESAITDFERLGKKSIFVGKESNNQLTLTRNSFVDIPLTALLGTIESDNKTFSIPEDALYEVMANFTAKPANAVGYLILNIRNYTQSANLAYTTVNQNTGFTTIASKAIFCGHLKQGDKIGIRIMYGSQSTATETLKGTILSVKKVNVQ